MASRLVTSANKMTLRDVVPGAQVFTELTIAGGAVVPSRGFHTLDTESDDASDDLDTLTLTNLRAGDEVRLVAVSAARVPTVKHGTGNITTATGQDIVMDSLTKIVRFTVNAAANGVVASLVSGEVATAPTLAALKARAAGVTGDRIFLAGRTSANDGGQGWFHWLAGDQSASVTLDTQSAVFAAPNSASTGASGVWKRDYPGEVWLEWFGAIGDADDAKAAANTTALQAMFAFCGAFASRSAKVGAGDFRFDNILLDTIRSVDLDGQGTGDAAKTGTTFRWKGSSSNSYLLDLRSCHSLRFSGIRFRTGTQTGKSSAIISTANASPALSNLRITFEDCLFQDDTSSGISTATIDWKSTANCQFIRCQFSTGIGIKLGKDTDVAPAGATGAGNPTEANGATTDTQFIDCMFFSDIVIEQAINLTLSDCYWEKRIDTNRISKISCSGNEEARNIIITNATVTYVGSSANVPIWYDGPTNAAEDNHGPLNVIGGTFSGYDVCFNLPNGIAEISGAKFLGNNTPVAAIAVGASFLGDLALLQNNDFTDQLSVAGAAITDARQAPKFTNSDATPSLAGSYAFTLADTPPAGGYTAFDDAVEGRTYIVFPGAAFAKINNNSSIACPGNQSFYVAVGGAPFMIYIKNAKAHVFSLGTPRRVLNAYGEETVTLSGGSGSCTNGTIVIAGEGGVADNLFSLSPTNYKVGDQIEARIADADAPITIFASGGNITTWNGKNVTITDPTVKFTFKVDSAGTGLILQPHGLTTLQQYNEPFGANDVPVVFFFGQSNCGPTGVAGTATGGALTYVQHMATGALAWSAFNTAGAGPFTTNCHKSESTLQASPYHSFAALWEASQAAYSLPILYVGMASQGGQTLSAKRASANASRWNPDHIISQADGSPDTATDGFYPVRWTGNTDSGAKWSLFELAQQMFRAGIDAIEASGKRARVLGVFWIHGESDSLTTTTANEYASHLARLHGAMSKAAGVDSVPMILSLVRSEAYAQRAIVNEAMLSFARATPFAQIIDPQNLPSYDANDDGDSPPHLGIYADGIHFTEDASDEWAALAFQKTILSSFNGLMTSKERRDRDEHRQCVVAVKANGSGSNDNNTTWDEFLDDGQASAVSRIEHFAGIKFSSSSQTLVQVFDPTTGRFTAPYTGTYKIKAQIRTSADAALATASVTGTELRIYSNSTRGAGATAGTLQGVSIGELITSGVTWNANGRTITMLADAFVNLTAGDEVIICNNNYRQASSTNYEWRGSIELVSLG